MGMREVESAITKEARIVLKNPKLRLKDVLEWSTAIIREEPGEVTVFLPEYKVHIAVLKEHDKR